jgi:hypothetical protein
MAGWRWRAQTFSDEANHGPLANGDNRSAKDRCVVHCSSALQASAAHDPALDYYRYSLARVVHDQPWLLPTSRPVQCLVKPWPKSMVQVAAAAEEAPISVKWERDIRNRHRRHRPPPWPLYSNSSNVRVVSKRRVKPRRRLVWIESWWYPNIKRQDADGCTI